MKALRAARQLLLDVLMIGPDAVETVVEMVRDIARACTTPLEKLEPWSLRSPAYIVRSELIDDDGSTIRLSRFRHRASAECYAWQIGQQPDAVSVEMRARGRQLWIRRRA